MIAVWIYNPMQKRIAYRYATDFDTRITDLECNPFKKDFDDAWMPITFALYLIDQFLFSFWSEEYKERVTAFSENLVHFKSLACARV